MGIEIPEFEAQAEREPEGRRLALLVCNGEYDDGRWNLPGVSADAEKIRRVLAHPEICGFEVRAVIEGGLVEARREVARVCVDAARSDTILIYYSGNATLDEDGRLHLLVADSDPDHPLATSLEPSFILDQLRQADCRNVVLVVDTCHAGAFFHRNQGIPNGLYAITSCAADGMAEDTPEGGAFTLAVIDGLLGAAADRDGDGRVTIQELHAYVKERLVRGSTTRQTPQKWEWNVSGPIYMTRAQRPVFLSYSRQDGELARRLKASLETEGITVWMDTDRIRSGDWKERIFDALDGARAFIFLMSERSLVSEVVRKEIALAARKNVPLIPVRIGEPEIPSWFEFDYGGLHRYDVTLDNLESTVGQLRAAIRDASSRSIVSKDASSP